MAAADALRVTLQVARVFDQLGVAYLVGGSLASSYHGIPRSTEDSDLVADLGLEHAEPLVSALGDAFYADMELIQDAIRRRTSFNLIHLQTMFKVDVFLPGDSPWSRLEMERREFVALGESAEDQLPLASAEDIVLEKLRWFQLGQGVSERQWRDVLGVLRVNRGQLDLDYLRKWAAETGLLALLERVLDEASTTFVPVDQRVRSVLSRRYFLAVEGPSRARSSTG